MVVTSKFSLNQLLVIAASLQIVWGLVPSASQLVIQEIPVEAYIALRWTISSLILLFFLRLRYQWMPSINKKTLTVAALGVGGYALASFGTLYGLKIGGVTNFALLGALNPIVTAFIAILFLREKPHLKFYAALPICVLGLVTLVVGKHQISSWNIALTSAALIIGAAVLEAIIFVFSKKLKAHFTSMQYLMIAQLGAALFMWLSQLVFYHQEATILHLSAKGWLAALFVSVVACVLCYGTLYWLLNHVDGHRLALFDGLHTLSAALFGFIFFNEVLSASMIVGGLLLLSGLVLGNLPPTKKKPMIELP